MNSPNILFLCADQMRGDALGCAGNNVIQTPTLDRLAAGGVRFSNAFSVNPVCVPARATMITGNYPHRCTGDKRNSGSVYADQVVMPAYFQQHGYRTYASGKLHFLPYSPPGRPRLTHGYEQVSLVESGRVVRTFDPSGSTAGLEDYHDYLQTVGWGGYTRAHGVGNNDIHPACSPLPAEHCVDAYVASRAIDYLRQHQRQHSQEPFFLFASFPKPHAPYDPPVELSTLYDPRTLPPPLQQMDDLPRAPGKLIEQITHGWSLFSPAMHQVAKAFYYALITFQDRQIQRILACLAELGQLQNTIILYTADHGDLTGDFGFWAKSCFYRGSVQVPMIYSAPGMIPAGQVLDDLTGTQDIFPTLAALAGIPIAHQIDGKDLTPWLTQTAIEPVRPYAVSYYNTSPMQGYMVADQKSKFIYNECNGVEELYDLEHDPQEQYNLIQESKWQEKRQHWKNCLIQWAKDNQEHEILTSNGELKKATRQLPGDTAFQPQSMGWRHY